MVAAIPAGIKLVAAFNMNPGMQQVINFIFKRACTHPARHINLFFIRHFVIIFLKRLADHDIVASNKLDRNDSLFVDRRNVVLDST